MTIVVRVRRQEKLLPRPLGHPATPRLRCPIERALAEHYAPRRVFLVIFPRWEVRITARRGRNEAVLTWPLPAKARKWAQRYDEALLHFNGVLVPGKRPRWPPPLRLTLP